MENNALPLEPDNGIHYTVQVGIFYSRQKAEKFIDALGSYKSEAWIYNIKSSGKNSYYVFVGRFGTEYEARLLGRAMHKNLAFIRYYYIIKNNYYIANNEYYIKQYTLIE